MTVSLVGSDLERLVPNLLDTTDQAEREIFALHEERYRYAARWVAGRTVADVACGAGYGSRLLLGAGARAVHGIDLSQDAIAYARERYGTEGLIFASADAMTVDLPSVDVFVSLETIEHLPDPGTFLERAARAVRQGGVVVASVPTTLSTDVNEYHLQHLTARQFRGLFTRVGLEVFDELLQRQMLPLVSLRPRPPMWCMRTTARSSERAL